jgi:glycosyltransferase involved in cell wall biosynthesis
MTSVPELSIVIPALNEEQRLPKTLGTINKYLHSSGRNAEVIVIDDGSRDRTPEVVDEMQKLCPVIRRISNPTNHGKGFAVRQGMLEARGEIALFTDADLSTPIEEAEKLLAAIRDDRCDGAVGSRALDRSLIQIHQSATRELGGILFNRFVRWITDLNFSDTQCGFKAFRREKAKILFEQQRIIGFGFDPEILFLAKRHGLKIVEVPVRWSHDAGSKVKFLKDGLAMAKDLWTIRQNAARGFYPVKSSEAHKKLP